MQKIRDKIRCASLKKALLLGVFAGLIFSCAEGIRLFPFPPPDAFQGLESIGHKPSGPGRHSYAKGLENGGGSTVSRSKPETGAHLPGAVVRAALPRFLTSVVLEDSSPEFVQAELADASVSRLPDKRGPPVFFNV